MQNLTQNIPPYRHRNNQRLLTQFRAVTGINIAVKSDQSLTFGDVSGGGGKRKKGRGKGGQINNHTMNGRTTHPAEDGERGDEEEEEMFRSVCCLECDHRVGVLDGEDVFHFFGVIASG